MAVESSSLAVNGKSSNDGGKDLADPVLAITETSYCRSAGY